MNIQQTPRKNLRLKDYDYTQQGLYFITICINNREKYFGDIANHILTLNNAGEMIARSWLELENQFPFIGFHEYIIMPNHFHGIIEIKDQSPIHLGDIIGAFKSITTNHYIKGVHEKEWQSFEKRFWQRNYYEHVIRDEKSYLKLSEYIQNNPLKWEDDEFYM